MRGAVLQVKPNEYVLAARRWGESPGGSSQHILPNAMAPVMVVSMINPVPTSAPRPR